jgi:2-keto-4-pentenoate hydratase/2-oxohepta-3-ene-1,7-dioic acid hydratase in catechol pathway
MAQRYVRVQNQEGRIYYGLLQLSQGVQVLDAPPWLQGQITDLYLEPDTYQILAPCAPSKIIAVGKNYADHAAEMGTAVPQEPLTILQATYVGYFHCHRNSVSSSSFSGRLRRRVGASDRRSHV